jgi:hypothetical protein
MSRSHFLLISAPAIGRRCRFGSLPRVFLAVICLGVPLSLRAQAPDAATYPVDPAAAAGMTRGLPNGVTGQQAEMMQVRTSAQGAQGEAAAAMMARSADQSIEERNQEIALQTAREKKSIKESMTERLRFERASASYNKVSANDMSTWKTEGGGVRVERNVPDAFLMSLIEEEEQAEAREAASGEKKGFGLFRKDDDSDPGGGFLSGIRPPRLPFMGGSGGSDPAPVTSSSAPAPSDTSEPSFAGSAQSSPAQAQAQAQASAPPKPGVVPMISGAALVDGRSPVNERETPASADRPPSSPQTVSFSDQTPETEKKKPGLFSKLQSDDDDHSSLVPLSNSSSSGGGGGFFGFGKKKPAQEVGKIDAGLFPEGAGSQAAIGTRLSGNPVSSSSAGGDSFASASPGAVAPVSSSTTVELPGQTVEKTRGFSMPKPSLSIPSMTKSGGGGGDNVPTLTTVNSAGSSYYVVASTAQFMVYGENQMQSEVRALPAGSVVLMTKPGEQWASVRLSNGTEGVLQNKHLRPASAAEAGGGFAAPAVAE